MHDCGIVQCSPGQAPEWWEEADGKPGQYVGEFVSMSNEGPTWDQ